MADTQQTLINGNRYSFQNLTVRAGDRNLPKGCITALSYNPTKEPGEVEGNLNVLVGRTEGVGKVTGSITLLLSEAADFYSKLTNDGEDGGITEVDFTIVAQYSVNGTDVITDTLRGVRMTGIDASHQQGPDAITRTHTLSIMRCTLDGIDAFSAPSEDE